MGGAGTGRREKMVLRRARQGYKGIERGKCIVPIGGKKSPSKPEEWFISKLFRSTNGTELTILL